MTGITGFETQGHRIGMGDRLEPEVAMRVQKRRLYAWDDLIGRTVFGILSRGDAFFSIIFEFEDSFFEVAASDPHFFTEIFPDEPEANISDLDPVNPTELVGKTIEAVLVPGKIGNPRYITIVLDGVSVVLSGECSVSKFDILTKPPWLGFPLR